MPITTQKKELERLLARPGWLQVVPAALRPAHRVQRQRDFARLVALWSPLLVLAFVGCVGFSFVFYLGQLQGRDLRVYLMSEGLALAVSALGLWMARQPRWQPKADAWIPFFLGFNLFVKVIGGFLLQQPALAVNQVYITLLVLLIGLLALQLSLRAALVGSALGLSAFLTAPWFADAAFARLFLGHYVLTAGVCLFVALVREDKDRIAFLQATLLDLERQEVQRLNEQLAEMALRDVLTGLSNRRRFDQALAQEWDRARRNRSALSLLMVDVDHFKAYNDHYGHPAGDQCLVHLAQAMASAVQRPADVVARYGGEEFVVLLPDTDQAGAVELARKLIEQIDQMALPHVMSSTAPHVTVSVGVATQSPLASMDRQGLVGAADAALYRAKRGGRHAVGV
jgi:diguanylate cyclase (GGDEF)-like protein